jgi:hypothetical protein
VCLCVCVRACCVRESTPSPYETDPDVRDVLLSVRFKEDLLELIEHNHHR